MNWQAVPVPYVFVTLLSIWAAVFNCVFLCDDVSVFDVAFSPTFEFRFDEFTDSFASTEFTSGARDLGGSRGIC